MRKILIDGNKIENLDDLYDQLTPYLLEGSCPWGKNLDSLDEVVSQSFNYTDDSNLNVSEIIWKDYKKSEERLGVETTIEWWNKKLSGKPVDIARVKSEIDKLKGGQGETLIAKLVDIFSQNYSTHFSKE